MSSSSRLRGEVVVEHVDAPAALQRRLAELGVRPGAVIHVLRQVAGGGVIVAIGDSRLAIDRATLRRLTLRPTSTGAA
ncbi:MAG: FeoA family protein [Actinomycetota bacterium]|nr:FeoA family protein [Actinomycetota bacterium]